MTRIVGRLVLASGAGALVYTSFPPVGWWPGAVLGLALLVVALGPVGSAAPRIRTGAAVGLVFGLVFFLLLLPWVGLYVGAYASWALSAVEALYLAAFGAGAVHLVRWGAAGGARGVGAAAGLAAWWSLWESVRGSWPWGGFPWGSLAFGHADGPLLALASLGGARFLGAAIAASGFALGLVVLVALRRPRVITAVAPFAVPAALFAAAGVVVAPGSPGAAESLRVAVIQGNVPRLGLEFASQRAAVLANHLEETHRLADRVRSGDEPQPDLVLWPENASDVPALRSPDVARAISGASVAVGAPISLGTIDPVPGGPTAYNTQVVWNGSEGPIDRHDKHYIQPFGEWLPWRGFFEAFFPAAEQAGHFVPGHGDGTLEVPGVVAGTATCFEVAFNAAARDPIAAGAQFLTVPTNNATFGHSSMTYQQLAMSRVRAVEHSVPVLVAATSEVSAIIAPDGTVEQQSEIFEAATLTADLRLGGAGTPATRWGGIVERTLGIVGAAATLTTGLAAGSGEGAARVRRLRPHGVLVRRGPSLGASGGSEH